MFFKKLRNHLFKQRLSRKARKFKDIYLPLIRSNEGLSNDQEYVNSAVEQVEDLLRYIELNANTCILDFGCGQGRFAIGLLLCIPSVKIYYGIDTNAESIDWCRRWLAKYHRNFIFAHVSAHNARYNPSEIKRPAWPVDAGSFDIVFMNSVFSHMLSDDIEYYLTQSYKALSEGGIIYTTAFIEEKVPPVVENPDNYLGLKSKGALHRVRYEKLYFLGMIQDAGFNMVDFQHQKFERTKQSVVIAKKGAQYFTPADLGATTALFVN